MLERLLARGTAAYCVVGSDLADRFAAVGVPRRRLHVVRSAVPLPVGLPSVAEARARVAQRYLLPAAGPLLCYVGSLEPRKNVLRLADVLAQVRAAGVPASLLVVGEGPQRGQLEQRLRGLGVAAHAVLTGHLAEPARVHEALRAADVALLLSNAEGLPQVLVQAAATGTRFVAYDVEGVGELLSLGARGTAVPHGDLDGVVRAVVDHPRAADGREPVADLTSWSPETIRVAYRDVFEAVLPGGSLRPALPLSAPA
jgi:glycosyltransferase involved in cell wall biosynthesis